MFKGVYHETNIPCISNDLTMSMSMWMEFVSQIYLFWLLEEPFRTPQEVHQYVHLVKFSKCLTFWSAADVLVPPFLGSGNFIKPNWEEKSSRKNNIISEKHQSFMISFTFYGSVRTSNKKIISDTHTHTQKKKKGIYPKNQGSQNWCFGDPKSTLAKRRVKPHPLEGQS